MDTRRFAESPRDRHETETERIDRRRARQRIVAAGISVISLGLVVVRLVWPQLDIDVATLALLLVAILPWLGGVFSRVELPGGWRLEYRELAERVERTERDVANVAHSARAALGAAQGLAGPASGPIPLPPRQRAQPYHPVRTVTPPAVSQWGGDRPDAELHELIARLVAEFAHVSTERSEPQRVGVMDRIFGKLMAIAPHTTDFDVRAALRSEHVGERLAGYAYLYARPDPALLGPLVEVLCRREDVPFNQYWALRAVALIVEAEGPEALSDDAAGQLLKLARTLPTDSKRYHMITRLFWAFGLKLSFGEPPVVGDSSRLRERT